MRKVLTSLGSAVLVITLAAALGPGPAAAKKNNGTIVISTGKNKQPCQTVKTTVCNNNGTGMKCRVVDTHQCKIY
jgi:hypothetical protein